MNLLYIFFILAVGAYVYLCMDNFSKIVFIKLYHEVNVLVVIVFLSILLIIDFGVLQVIYTTCTICYLLTDALIYKSTKFIIALGCLINAINLLVLFTLIFMKVDSGLVIVKVFDIPLYKRDVRRSCYFNILTLLTKGLFGAMLGENQNKLLFCTGALVRRTGTTSRSIIRRSYVESRGDSIAHEMMMQEGEL